MIQGIGIDIVELNRIEEILKRNPRFVERILTDKERHVVSNKSAKRKIEFIAGRFAAKEALVKASGVKSLSWQDIEILNQEDGKPILTGPVDGTIHVSISHSQAYAVAQVIIEG